MQAGEGGTLMEWAIPLPVRSNSHSQLVITAIPYRLSCYCSHEHMQENENENCYNIVMKQALLITIDNQ